MSSQEFHIHSRRDWQILWPQKGLLYSLYKPPVPKLAVDSASFKFISKKLYQLYLEILHNWRSENIEIYNRATEYSLEPNGHIKSPIIERAIKESN